MNVDLCTDHAAALEDLLAQADDDEDVAPPPRAVKRTQQAKRRPQAEPVPRRRGIRLTSVADIEAAKRG